MGLCASCCTRNKAPAKSVTGVGLNEGGLRTQLISEATHTNSDALRSSQKDMIDSERLSLPVAPAQLPSLTRIRGEHWQHVHLDGYLVKRGHRVRNWKRRYFILRDGSLSYYGSKSDTDVEPVGKDLKGAVNLTGARVAKKITDHGRYTINVLTTEGEKDMYLEAQNEQEMDEWYQYINMEILASNVDSLQRGERVPTVQVWYKQEHKRYEDSMRLIGFGHSVVVHVIDRTGFDHLLSSWIQCDSSGRGLLFTIAKDKQQTKGEMSPLEKQLHGTLILFQDIQYVRDMPAKPVQKSNRFGPHSAFFSIVTETESYDIEIETQSRAQQWIQALNDVISFLSIPVPAARTL